MKNEKRNDYLKRIKKTEKLLEIIIFGLIFAGLILVLNRSGWRLSWFLEKVRYIRYEQAETGFELTYPDYFRLDKNPARRSDPNFIAGIFLRGDEKVRCDLESLDIDLDWSQESHDMSRILEEDLRKKAQVVEIESQERSFKGERAFWIEASFLDYQSNLICLREAVFPSMGSSYRLSCGAACHQFKYYQEDFKKIMNELERN